MSSNISRSLNNPKSPFESRRAPKQPIPDDVSDAWSLSEDENQVFDPDESFEDARRSAQAASLTTVSRTHYVQKYNCSPGVTVENSTSSPRRLFPLTKDCPSPLGNFGSLHPSHSLQSVNRGFLSISGEDEQVNDSPKQDNQPISVVCPSRGWSSLTSLNIIGKSGKDGRLQSPGTSNKARPDSSFISTWYNDEGKPEDQPTLVATMKRPNAPKRQNTLGSPRQDYPLGSPELTVRQAIQDRPSPPARSLSTLSGQKQFSGKSFKHAPSNPKLAYSPTLPSTWVQYADRPLPPLPVEHPYSAPALARGGFGM